VEELVVEVLDVPCVPGLGFGVGLGDADELEE